VVTAVVVAAQLDIQVTEETDQALVPVEMEAAVAVAVVLEVYMVVQVAQKNMPDVVVV
jgi:hypothetical protein